MVTQEKITLGLARDIASQESEKDIWLLRIEETLEKNRIKSGQLKCQKRQLKNAVKLLLLFKVETVCQDGVFR